MMSASFLSVTFLSWPKSLLSNVTPFRRRAAQVRRERCVCALTMLGRPSKHKPDHQILQAKRMFHWRAWDHFFGLHTTRLERISVEQDEVVGALDSSPRCLLLCLSFAPRSSSGLRGASDRSARC